MVYAFAKAINVFLNDCVQTRISWWKTTWFWREIDEALLLL